MNAEPDGFPAEPVAMPVREASHAADVALLSAAQMARADALAVAAGMSSFALMQAAGEATAHAAARMVSHGPILVLAGRGNNGGDGFVAAQILAAQGRDVSVMLLCARDSLKGDAAKAAQGWRGAVLPFALHQTGRPALIIDALFGAGLNRPVKGDPLQMIAALNASGIPILSIDLPSGIDADTGAIMGDAVRAARTVTFFRRKPGHLLLPGRMHCGPTEVADIGIPTRVLETIAPRTVANEPALWGDAFPVPRVEGHKYARGHAVVLSGGAEHTGAARLAARGALRAGAGLVTVASPDDALAINAAALTAIMVRRMNSPDALRAILEDRRINSMVVGPGAGVGQATRDLVHTAAAAGQGLVLDADALTSFAHNPGELFSALKARRTPAILTPHQGEFSRLFSDLRSGSKLDSARDAAARSSAILILKGPDTVVASPDGRAAIADNAPPWLATAGAGDVLAGIVAGLLAQGVAPFEAASIGVWLHGEAARRFGPGLTAEDLPDSLPRVFRRLYKILGKDFQPSTA